MNQMEKNSPKAVAAEPPDPVDQAALELVTRHPANARGIAQERVSQLERAARWQEHATALRVLTAVERLLDRPAD